MWSIFLDYYIGSLLLWKGKNESFEALSCEPVYGYVENGSPEYIVADGQQRLTAMSSLMAFFRGNVGRATDPTFNRNFSPSWGIPATVTDETGAVQPYPARSDRGFTPPVPIKVFEDFTWQTGTQQLWLSQRCFQHYD